MFINFTYEIKGSGIITIGAKSLSCSQVVTVGYLIEEVNGKTDLCYKITSKDDIDEILKSADLLNLTKTQVNKLEAYRSALNVFPDNSRHKNNRNHHIVEVIDTLNPSSNPTWSCYFDGTQSQAIKHFTKDEKLKSYRQERYIIIMRTNSIVLWESE